MRANFNKDAERIVIYDGRFLRLLKQEEWEFIQRNNCNGIVIIVAITKEEKLLFVEQYRPPVQKTVIEFPAGLVNDHDHIKDETLIQGALRELFEETGYKAKRAVKMLEGPVSAGSSADIVAMIQAFDLEKVADGGGDEFESITVHEVPLAECDQWLKEKESQGFLIEPKIYTGLYFLKHYNRADF